MSAHRYARVVVDIPARALNRSFTYSVPEEIQEKIETGHVAEVPFGRQCCLGVVIEVFNELSEDDKKYELREITALPEELPFWNGELMNLVRLMRTLYGGTWYESFQTVVPAPVLQRMKAMWSKKRILPARKKKNAEAAEVYPEIPLTRAQEDAVDLICRSAEDGKPVLLYGVTGSGKTEVYLHSIKRMLAAGKNALVLVPELSLTPQAVQRYRGRLGDKVGILHSALSVSDRRNYWWAMRRGELQIALGTRSAVFAPFSDLGIICIDEEHETSYKQENLPRYHARQIAFKRAKEHKAALVLGSATPSLESFYLASRGLYHLAELPERPGGRKLPTVRVADMRRSANAGKLISSELAEAIRLRLELGQQTVLLLNRRGFAGFIQCPECGYVPSCPNCSISLTWHKKSGKLLCHYCCWQQSLEAYCPQCRSVNFRAGAPGTERLLAELSGLFPNAGISRLDRDTVGRIGSHEAILEEFGSGKTQILLGTKMVAKGLDYPNVTLVGILKADAEFNQPDFRAGERAFQLLSQASGRAGRGAFGGEVIIQAHDVNNYILESVVNHDYKAMYNYELSLRKQLIYPPFCRLLRVIVSGESEAAVIGCIRKTFALISADLKDCQILGPAPCPIERLQGRFRWHILIKGQSLIRCIDVCSEAVRTMSMACTNLRVSMDPDPQSLF